MRNQDVLFLAYILLSYDLFEEQGLAQSLLRGRSSVREVSSSIPWRKPEILVSSSFLSM